MDGIVAVGWIVGALLTWDMVRRPGPEWDRADRRKGSWVTGSVICTLFVFPLPFCLVAYLVGVVPRFSSTAGDAPGKFTR